MAFSSLFNSSQVIDIWCLFYMARCTIFCNKHVSSMSGKNYPSRLQKCNSSAKQIFGLIVGNRTWGFQSQQVVLFVLRVSFGSCYCSIIFIIPILAVFISHVHHTDLDTLFLVDFLNQHDKRIPLIPVLFSFLAF